MITEKLGNVITHRKEFITIDNSVEYKRCRVQVNRKGIVLRDVIKGVAINTKKQQVCKEGDFLVAEIDAKVGGYGFVGKDLEGAIVSSHYFLFEVDESKLLSDYLAWLIKTDIIQEQITSKGSTNYAAIRPHHVLNFEIPLPSVAEQEVIVNRLNNINAEYSLIDKELNQQHTYLQLLRQTILQEAVQGKLTNQDSTDEPATELLKRIKAEKEKLAQAGMIKKEKELPPITEDEIPSQLPQGWVWCRLLNISTLITDGKHGDSQNEPNSSYYFLSAKDVKDGKLNYDYARQITYKDFLETHRRTNLEPGDICIVNTGATVGKIAIAPTHELTSRTTFQKSVAIIKLLKGFILTENVEMFLLSVMPQLMKKSGGSAINNLLLRDLSNVLFPLPPLAEQHRIVARVQQLQQQLSKLETQVQQSRQYAQQLLQSVLKEAFGQKGKVYEMEDEVVSLVAEENK